MSTTEVDWVPIYYANRRVGRGRPSGYITRAAARQIVDAGLAEWTAKAKSLKVLKEESEVKIRDHSCQMGPRVILQAADGNGFFAAIVDAWKPRFAA